MIDRKYIWLFPVAIVIGSVFTNIAGYDAVSKWDIFSEPVVNRIINADNTFAEIVGYVAPKRIRLFIIVFLISISPFCQVVLRYFLKNLQSTRRKIL